MWLLGRLTPDSKTIADFRKDNLAALKAVCRELTLLCRQLDLFGGELIAIDGSKFRADNSRRRNFSRESLARLIRQADEKVTTYLEELGRQDAAEVTAGGPTAEELRAKIEHLKKRRLRHQGLAEELRQSGASELTAVRQGLDVC